MLSAVVFDFDGTLARPALDFSLMKLRLARLAEGLLGAKPQVAEGPALEWIEDVAGLLDASQGRDFRGAAHALICAMELEAAARTSLFPFVRGVLSRLRSQGVGTAIITRNIRQCVEMVFPDAADYVAVVLTRDDVAAVKPDPGHLLAALEALGVQPGRALMVGDHPQDVQTAKRAGVLSAAVDSGGSGLERLRLAGPDYLEPDVNALFKRLERDGLLGALTL